MLATTSSAAPPSPAAATDAAPRLLDRVRAAARARHYSPLTEQIFVSWIRRYVLFHDKRHPAQMAEPEVVRFLSHLAVEEHVSPSLQSQARAALVFLYRHVLHQPLGSLDGVVRAQRREPPMRPRRRPSGPSQSPASSPGR